MDELYQRIIDTYKETGSVKQTAEVLDTYAIKVRRVLITEGLWHSRTSDQITELMEQGLTAAEIAEKLVISEKNVQSYMPYRRGQYGGENRSGDAVRSEEYRGRMHTAAENLVTNTEARMGKSMDKQEEQNRKIKELKAEKERLLAEKKRIWDSIEAAIKQTPLALQLHLELDMEYADDADKEVLRRYGRMNEAISRDFIVPGNMTLHGLHYAIMKAFGWQNSHLHSYEPDAEDFLKMTNGGQVKEWVRQVGMYFRFPSEDFDDIYWDDDYEEGLSFKTWLKNKYTGPYNYDGTGEHYIPSQRKVDDFLKCYPDVMKKFTDQRGWNVTMSGSCAELLERHIISDVLLVPWCQFSWDEWKSEKEEMLKPVESCLKAEIKKYVELNKEMGRISEKLEPYYSGESGLTDEMLPAFREMDEKFLEMDKLFFENDPEPIPVMSSLVYSYDYGDGWTIKITCTNAWYNRSTYSRSDDGDILMDRNGLVTEKLLYQDAFGQSVSGDDLERILNVIHRQRPVCIAWDGMNLVDDVGGIGGFCEFLETINGTDQEEKRSYKEWARGLGWTGRMSKPENIL